MNSVLTKSCNPMRKLHPLTLIIREFLSQIVHSPSKGYFSSSQLHNNIASKNSTTSMNLNDWCCNTGCGSSDVGGYDLIVSFKVVEVNGSKRSKTPRWRVLWRKIVKERKKMFNCLASPVLHYSYDPYAYSKNFDDQGSIWVDDQDDISRSFSARFAVPSRRFDM